MRRKARARKTSPRGAQGDTSIRAAENTHLMVIKQIEKPAKTPTGKGLGKAGAKRLGRLLKRAIQIQDQNQNQESSVRRKVSPPKTPVRLFKHQIQTEAENAPKTNSAKPASPHVSQLILSVVSQCKHRGGITMAELKQTLAAGGYDVTKNSRQVNVVTKRLVNNETLVRTTRNATLRLNNKKQADTKQVRMRSVKPPKPKADPKANKTASKSPKEAEKSKRQARKTPKPKGKSHKRKGQTRRAVAKSHKQKGKPRKAAAKSHKPRRKTPKARRKSPKPVVMRRRSPTKRAARVRKAPRKAQRARRHRPKQNQPAYKSSWKRKPTRRRHPKTRSRLRTQQCRVARRRTYYH